MNNRININIIIIIMLLSVTVPYWTSDVIKIQGDVAHQERGVINPQHMSVISQVSVAG